MGSLRTMASISPHNAFFRATFGQPRIAASLLRAVLSPDLAARIDFGALEARPEHFVDPKLSDRETDLLFRAPIDGNDAFVYLLFEHQSSVERMMAWRVLQYMVRIWDRWRRDHPRAACLPLIVPVVIYHGRRRWSAPLRFEQLVATAGGISVASPQTPSFSYVLFNLRDLSTQQIGELAVAASVKLFLLVLKHIHDERLPQLLHGWHELIREAVLADPGGLRLLEVLLTYLAASGAGMNETELVQCGKAVGHQGEEVAMTLAQQLVKKGIEQGKHGLVLRLLRLRFGELPAWAEQRMRDGTADDVERWAERILTASSLEEVLA